MPLVCLHPRGQPVPQAPSTHAVVLTAVPHKVKLDDVSVVEKDTVAAVAASIAHVALPRDGCVGHAGASSAMRFAPPRGAAVAAVPLAPAGARGVASEAVWSIAIGGEDELLRADSMVQAAHVSVSAPGGIRLRHSGLPAIKYAAIVHVPSVSLGDDVDAAGSTAKAGSAGVKGGTPAAAGAGAAPGKAAAGGGATGRSTSTSVSIPDGGAANGPGSSAAASSSSGSSAGAHGAAQPSSARRLVPLAPAPLLLYGGIDEAGDLRDDLYLVAFEPSALASAAGPANITGAVPPPPSFEPRSLFTRLVAKGAATGAGGASAGAGGAGGAVTTVATRAILRDGPTPGPRAYHALASNAAGTRVVLFGGMCPDAPVTTGSAAPGSAGSASAAGAAGTAGGSASSGSLSKAGAGAAAPAKAGAAAAGAGAAGAGGAATPRTAAAAAAAGASSTSQLASGSSTPYLGQQGPKGPIARSLRSDVWVLDTASWSWSRVRAQGIPPAPRARCSAVFYSSLSLAAASGGAGAGAGSLVSSAAAAASAAAGAAAADIRHFVSIPGLLEAGTAPPTLAPAAASAGDAGGSAAAAAAPDALIIFGGIGAEQRSTAAGGKGVASSSSSSSSLSSAMHSHSYAHSNAHPHPHALDLEALNGGSSVVLPDGPLGPGAGLCSGAVYALIFDDKLAAAAAGDKGAAGAGLSGGGADAAAAPAAGAGKPPAAAPAAAAAAKGGKPPAGAAAASTGAADAAAAPTAISAVWGTVPVLQLEHLAVDVPPEVAAARSVKPDGLPLLQRLGHVSALLPPDATGSSRLFVGAAAGNAAALSPASADGGEAAGHAGHADASLPAVLPSMVLEFVSEPALAARLASQAAARKELAESTPDGHGGRILKRLSAAVWRVLRQYAAPHAGVYEGEASALSGQRSGRGVMRWQPDYRPAAAAAAAAVAQAIASGARAAPPPPPAGAAGLDGAPIPAQYVDLPVFKASGDTSAAAAAAAEVAAPGPGVDLAGGDYSGGWSADRMHGLEGGCTLRLASGAVYEGAFAGGRFHGAGRMQWPAQGFRFPAAEALLALAGAAAAAAAGSGAGALGSSSAATGRVSLNGSGFFASAGLGAGSSSGGGRSSISSSLMGPFAAVEASSPLAPLVDFASPPELPPSLRPPRPGPVGGGDSGAGGDAAAGPAINCLAWLWASYEGQWQGGLPHGRGRIAFTNGAVYEGTVARGVVDGGVGTLSFSVPAGEYRRVRIAALQALAAAAAAAMPGAAAAAAAAARQAAAAAAAAASGSTHSGESDVHAGSASAAAPGASAGAGAIASAAVGGGGGLPSPAGSLAAGGDARGVAAFQPHSADRIVAALANAGGDVTFTASGGWRAGALHGEACEVAVECEVFAESAAGSFKDGRAHGRTRHAGRDGSLFEGQYYAGKRNGLGRLRGPDGAVYEGKFVAGARCGRGVLAAADGSVFAGEWRRDAPHGDGFRRTLGGVEQRGVWRYGVYEPPHGSSEA